MSVQYNQVTITAVKNGWIVVPTTFEGSYSRGFSEAKLNPVANNPEMRIFNDWDQLAIWLDDFVAKSDDVQS